MSELAYDKDGEPIPVPATAERWRTRRFNNPDKPGGAQVVYGPDSLPLYLDIGTTAAEFQEAVGGVPGRYRLDAVDAHNRAVDGVPPAYLMIGNPAAAGGGGGYSAPPPTSSATEHALVEMARANCEVIKCVAEKFGGMCDSMAKVITAADGAGLPRRAPLGPLLVDRLDDEDDGDDEPRNAAAQPPQPPQPPWATMLTQLVQIVQMFSQAGGGNGPPKLGALVGQVVETAKVVDAVATPAAPTAPEGQGVEVAHDARVASAMPSIPRAPRDAARTRSSAPTESRGPSAVASAPAAGAPVDPLAQFAQVLSALTPEEQAQVQNVMTTLSVGDVMAWYQQLAAMPVAEAVTRIRTELARLPTAPTAPIAPTECAA